MYHLLQNIILYYQPYIKIVENHLSPILLHIETKMKETIKLAKWNDTDYFTLSASTISSHRKVMSLTKDYIDQLNHTFRLIISQYKIKTNINPWNYQYLVDLVTIKEQKDEKQQPSFNSSSSSSFGFKIKANYIPILSSNHILNIYQPIHMINKYPKKIYKIFDQKKLQCKHGSHQKLNEINLNLINRINHIINKKISLKKKHIQIF